MTMDEALALTTVIEDFCAHYETAEKMCGQINGFCSTHRFGVQRNSDGEWFVVAAGPLTSGTRSAS